MALLNTVLVSNTIQTLYDAYSPLFYGIALELTNSETEAEEILLATFRKINNQIIEEQSSTFNAGSLTKLVICTAHELRKQKNLLKVKPLEEHPLIQSLLCENISIDEYCEKNQVLKILALQQLREEFLKSSL
jgi:hypothetical protein